jgi:hypothetical protein
VWLRYYIVLRTDSGLLKEIRQLQEAVKKRQAYDERRAEREKKKAERDQAKAKKDADTTAAAIAMDDDDDDKAPPPAPSEEEEALVDDEEDDIEGLPEFHCLMAQTASDYDPVVTIFTEEEKEKFRNMTEWEKVAYVSDRKAASNNAVLTRENRTVRQRLLFSC